MEAKYIGNNLNKDIRDQIYSILCECDLEFYPPLSARNSSAQKNLDLKQPEEGGKPYTYFEEMINQDFILAQDGEKVVGFMTFRRNYSCSALNKYGESLYITTICVRKSHRNHGALSMMYDEIERNVSKSLNCPYISTRTWSKNEAQIHTLEKRGYSIATVLKNDRGNGIDTVYYIIKISQ